MKNELMEEPSIIIRHALLYAIAHIQRLPKDRREKSDMVEMCRIVRSGTDPQLKTSVERIERLTGASIDLWPDDPEFIESGSVPDGSTKQTETK